MPPTPSDSHPEEDLRLADAEGGDAMGDGPPFNWTALVPRVVHPVKIAIIEAMSWIGRPLSPLELADVFDGQFSLGSVVQHVKGLAELDAIAVADGGAGRSIVSTRYLVAVAV